MIYNSPSFSIKLGDADPTDDDLLFNSSIFKAINKSNRFFNYFYFTFGVVR